jgi:nucleotide-binding universal stress UspA family protein
MIRNILIPVDFSDASANALRFAYSLNRHFIAHLHILHLFDVPITTGDDAELYLKNYDSYRKSFDDDLWAFVKTHKGEFHYDTDVYSTSGGHYQGIVDFARKHPTDMVILGNKGAGGLRRWMFGSVARYMLTHPSVPVMAVPEVYTKTDIGAVVLATDLSTLLPVPQLELLKNFCVGCKASLDIIHVRDKNEISLPAEEKVQQQCMDYIGKPCTIIATQHGETVSGTINRYILDNQTDLLVTIPHAHTWIDRLLIGSETRELANIVKIPVMSLPGK